MKFKVIQGEKGKKQNREDQMPAAENPGMPENSKLPENSKIMDEYYAKDRPRSQDIEQAEGDEDIVDSALKNQAKKGDAA